MHIDTLGWWSRLDLYQRRGLAHAGSIVRCVVAARHCVLILFWIAVNCSGLSSFTLYQQTCLLLYYWHAVLAGDGISEGLAKPTPRQHVGIAKRISVLGVEIEFEINEKLDFKVSSKFRSGHSGWKHVIPRWTKILTPRIST